MTKKVEKYDESYGYRKMNKKERLVRLLKTSVRHWNLYRKWNKYKKVDLRKADLHGANLYSACLRGTNLRNADLRDADLQGADLRDADLMDADLREADLQGADLRGADLQYANLISANLCYANLISANLDFASWNFSCKSLSTKIDSKIIRQLLFHACKPVENEKVEIDSDIKKLFNSKLFQKVVNKFHRVDETGEFKGVLK